MVFNKQTFGFEIIEIRLGGVEARLQSTQMRLKRICKWRV